MSFFSKKLQKLEKWIKKMLAAHHDLIESNIKLIVASLVKSKLSSEEKRAKAVEQIKAWLQANGFKCPDSVMNFYIEKALLEIKAEADELDVAPVPVAPQ